MEGKIKIAIVLGLTGILVFSTYQVLAGLGNEDKVTERRVIGYYMQKGKVDYSAQLKPNLIYGTQEVSNADLYSALIERMNLRYTYSFTGGDAEGNYSIDVFLTPSKSPEWEKKIYSKSGVFSKGFTEEIPLNWTEMLGTWKAIERETNYNFGSPTAKMEVYVNVKGNVKGSEVAEKFNQTASVVYGRLIQFSGLEKNQDGKVYGMVERPYYISVLGLQIKPSTAVMLFGITLSASALSLAGLLYIWRDGINEYIRSREKRTFEKKFGRYIVKASGELNGGKIINVDLNGLGKLSNELDRPILDYGDRYVVIDGGYTYTARV